MFVGNTEIQNYVPKQKHIALCCILDFLNSQGNTVANCLVTNKVTKSSIWLVQQSRTKSLMKAKQRIISEWIFFIQDSTTWKPAKACIFYFHLLCNRYSEQHNAMSAYFGKSKCLLFKLCFS